MQPVRLPSVPADWRAESTGATIGVILDEQGAPVASALVLLLAAATTRSQDRTAFVQTAASGQFVFANLAYGTHWIEVRRVGYLRQRHEIYARDGLVDTVIVRLRPLRLELHPIVPTTPPPNETLQLTGLQASWLTAWRVSAAEHTFVSPAGQKPRS